MSLLSARPSSIISPVPQHVSRPPTIGILTTHPPTLCGIAQFSSALTRSLVANGVEVHVVRIGDGSPGTDSRVVGELVNGSPASVADSAELLNRADVAVVQHDFAIYGGADGAEVLDIIAALRVPSIVIAHAIPKAPTKGQRRVLETIAATADHIVVLSDVAHAALSAGYQVDRRKVSTIAHGATPATAGGVKRSGRPTLLSFGLLGPGKGIERVIDAMASVRELPGRPRYQVAGRTHPRVLAAEGEAYREARCEQARRAGVADSVSFDGEYRSQSSLSMLIQGAAAVVLPYDSTDQVSSGVLVDALANGRPVIATAFPVAVELLSGGAGIVVPHDDQDALVSALHRVLTQPRLAGSMSAVARELAPTMAWSVVAGAYLALAQRLLAVKSARV